MEKVTATLNDPHFHDFKWICSIEESEQLTDIEESKQLTAYEKGIFCLLHKNLAKEAIQYLEKSELAESLYLLGRVYIDGCNGVEKDEVKGMEYFNKSYSTGNLDAGFTLARIYLYGTTAIAQSVHAAEFICDDLLSKNYNRKCTPNKIGFYSTYIFVELSLGKYQKAAEFIELAAKDGCTCCYALMGTMYAMGQHFPQDERKAIEMYLKTDLTKCHSHNVLWNIGRSYRLVGEYKNAVKYFIMAARKYTDPSDQQSCYDNIESIIENHPKVITELIKDDWLKS